MYFSYLCSIYLNLCCCFMLQFLHNLSQLVLFSAVFEFCAWRPQFICYYCCRFFYCMKNHSLFSHFPTASLPTPAFFFFKQALLHRTSMYLPPDSCEHGLLQKGSTIVDAILQDMDIFPHTRYGQSLHPGRSQQFTFPLTLYSIIITISLHSCQHLLLSG